MCAIRATIVFRCSDAHQPALISCHTHTINDAQSNPGGMCRARNGGSFVLVQSGQISASDTDGEGEEEGERERTRTLSLSQISAPPTQDQWLLPRRPRLWTSCRLSSAARPCSTNRQQGHCLERTPTTPLLPLLNTDQPRFWYAKALLLCPKFYDFNANS